MAIKKITPYEDNHDLIQLALAFVVVPQGQSAFIKEKLYEQDSALVLRFPGVGTASSSVYAALGVADANKRVCLGVIRKERWLPFKEAIEAKFAVSSYSRGIAFLVNLDSVFGVSVYKFLANLQVVDKPVKKKLEPRKEALDMVSEVKKEASKKYTAVFAVVNNGYTDLVMNAAREKGARGGTIITARGSGDKETGKFFGVLITPEKEIVMILVPKDIADNVMTAINEQAGLATKGQGILFSLPVEDVAGLAKEETGK